MGIMVGYRDVLIGSCDSLYMCFIEGYYQCQRKTNTNGDMTGFCFFSLYGHDRVGVEKFQYVQVIEHICVS